MARPFVHLACALLLAQAPCWAHAETDFNLSAPQPSAAAPYPPRDKAPAASHEDEGATQGGAIFNPFAKAEAPTPAATGVTVTVMDAGPDDLSAPWLAIGLALAIAIAFALLLRRAWSASP